MRLTKTTFCYLFWGANIIFLLFVGAMSVSSFASQNDDLSALIRRVQNTSQKFYDSIDSVFFSGYSKSYVYLAYGPFDIKLIPYLEEYYFDGYWIKPDSIRIIIKAQRIVVPDSEKVNIGKGVLPLPNPFHYLYDPSALGMPAKKTFNRWPLYPFARGADSLYLYQKINEIGFGENRIYTVSVAPRDNAIPAVHGTYQLDVNKAEVVASDVIFNEASSFVNPSVSRSENRFSLSISGSENHKVKTQKALLLDTYWLPTNLEEEVDMKLWGIKVCVQRLIRFDSYLVNPIETESISPKNEKVTYAPDSTLEKKLFSDLTHPAQLSQKEQEEIIKSIENKFSAENLLTELLASEAIAKEAYRQGLEQKFGTYFNFAQNLGKFIRYDRIEGLGLNYGFHITNFVLNNAAVSFNGSYGVKDKQWKGEVDFLVFLDKRKKIFFESNAYKTLSFEEQNWQITTGKNTLTSLLYKGDYRDYYYKTGAQIGLGVRANENLALKIAVVAHDEKNAFNHTRFSLFNNKQRFRLNPEITEGRNNAINATLLYRSYHLDIDLSGEFSSRSKLNHDFSYQLLKFYLHKSFRPGMNSYFHVHLLAGFSFGQLPPQKWLDFGGKTFLSYYGNLRGVDYKAFTGDRMISTIVDYSITGTAFYDYGIKLGLLKALKLTCWSGFGWSSLSEKNRQYADPLSTPTETTDGVYHEIGIGIGDRLNIFRIDLIWNTVAKNRLQVGFNVLR